MNNKDISTRNNIYKLLNTNKANLTNNGKKIYKNNVNMSILIDLFNDDKFKKLIEALGDTEQDIKLFSIFIKIYLFIDKLYPELNKYEQLALLNEAITNQNIRKKIFTTDSHQKSQNLLTH